MNFVKSTIDDWDPIDLFPHAPSDEYHSEIEKIQRLLVATEDLDKLTEGIYEIFVESFGRETFNKSKEECKRIARILLHKSID